MRSARTASERPSVRLDRFAELLSQDLPILVIAERMGIGRGAAYKMHRALVAKFGWQAA